MPKSNLVELVESAALAAAVSTSAVAMIPGSTPVGIAAIAPGMLLKIASEYGASYEISELKSAFVAAAKAFSGPLLFSTSIVGVIPGLGNAVNGMVTYRLLKKLGFAAVHALEHGKDLRELSSGDWESYLRMAESGPPSINTNARNIKSA